jgi:hypothetical protein
MADPGKRCIKNPTRNEVVGYIIFYAIFIGVMLALVPKDKKWWLDHSPTQSSDVRPNWSSCGSAKRLQGAAGAADIPTVQFKHRLPADSHDHHKAFSGRGQARNLACPF